LRLIACVFALSWLKMLSIYTEFMAIRRQIPAGPYPDIDYASMVLQRWLAHWHDRGFGNWAISARDTPEKIIGFGGVSLRSYNDVTINNLGYRFSTEAWGKGLATEFAIGAIRYGFEALKLAEMSAVVRANHLASQKVLEKAGMRYINDIADVRCAAESALFFDLKRVVKPVGVTAGAYSQGWIAPQPAHQVGIAHRIMRSFYWLN
jgi:RimJ/RimL family protein N-acetyltransferase